MTTARYAIAFSFTAALLSLFSAHLLYPASEAAVAPIAFSIPVFAAAYAAALTWAAGRAKGQDFGIFEGVVITTGTFVATVATDVLLRGPTSFADFVQNLAALLLWGLILQGWYVIPIGAAVPWGARKVFRSPDH